MCKADIFVNCIYLSKAGPIFVTFEDIENHTEKQLSVITDVFTDMTNSNNSISIYSIHTTFAHSIINVDVNPESKPLFIISINYLLIMLPCESSKCFSAVLWESLLILKDWKNIHVCEM